VAEGDCRFGVLGPLALEQDGQPVPLPSGRQRSLLALLLLGGGVPLSRDRLIDELWGERPPASAVSALHVHLSKLRGLLGGLLVLDPAGYSLRPGAFEVDVWRFDALVEQAREDPGQARRLLGEALALFRGEPLCDVASEGSVASWRRALEEKRLQATVFRFDAELAAGAAGELLADLERLAAEHPWEERVWRQLMLALYRAGRQADALEAYQRARRMFASELGLEPGESLSRLNQQILERAPELAAGGDRPEQEPRSPAEQPAALASHEQPQPPPSNIPQPVTRLVGRESDLAVLEVLLADTEVRIATLTGPGGVGKTRLLLELARRATPHYADGALFVRLERLTDPALVAAEIATALARRDGTDGPTADGLASSLRERELLIVIDNFEHLSAAAPLVAELLAHAPRIRVLVSSRTALRIRGEQVYEVEPLRLPEGESEQELSESPAVQLFLQSALASNRRLEIDLEVTRTVAKICQALDGLPLAIELAASRSHSHTPAQIAEQLAQPLTIGERALRDLPDRQQTLQGTIRWSYDLLEPDAQEVLRGTAVFLGGFTLPALEDVLRRPARAQLDVLLEASLVRRQTVVGRFELLELVRAFGLDELHAIGRDSEARARHRRHFAEQVAPAIEAFDDGAAPGEIAAPLFPDHANIRAALESAVGEGDDDCALALALGLRPLWISGALRLEAQQLVDRVIEHCSIPGAKELALMRIAAFLDYGVGANTWNRRVAARAAELGDTDTLATSTGNLFGTALNARDFDEMRRLRPQLLALITPETSTRAIGWIHYFLALDAYVDGRYESAAEHSAMSAEKAEQAGHEFMLAGATTTRLLSESARDRVMTQPQLAAAIEVWRRPGVQPLAVIALWFVARYAAGVETQAVGRWLGHAERILIGLGAELWPESVLRDEALAVLGITEVGPLLDAAPPLDPAAALAEAAAWVAARDPAETSPRENVVRLSSAG
jgi:predicted ATPase/DNA-binding SARP family transcriptional activator